ncbi:phage holin [Bacillus subtilis]|nr:phage holin [Bacillus subtilis]
MGVIVDSTTQGISDSKKAMDYDSPRKNPCPSLEEGIFFAF